MDNIKTDSQIEVSVCFPAFNEQKNIEISITQAIKAMENLSYKYEILVINDGSKDQTENIVKNLENKYPQVKLHNHLKNQGYAITTRTCLEKAKGKYIFVIDSDRQHNLFDIEKFMEVMEQGYDLAVGWKKDRKDPYSRIILAKGYNFLFRQLFNSNLHDVDCGFRCLTKSSASKIKIGYESVPVGPEIFARALHQKMKIAEVIVKHYPPVQKSTLRINPNKILNISKGLFSLKMELSKKRQ
jgi:glycosyltransferase involved in cell wall biosynthesis